MEVVYEDAPEAITRGGSWRGTPYQIGDQTFSHGIGFNSTKHIRVHLAQTGKNFSAQVGLENNDDTRRGAQMGNGSVTFEVRVRGKVAASTPVRRLKDPAVPLNVKLEGAREFELRVGDGGDGRGWDQALWAAALITFEDGRTLRLQDLPILPSGGMAPVPFSFHFRGKPSTEFLKNLTNNIAEKDAQGRRQLQWLDPTSGLEVRTELTVFKDFPVVEWVVHFANLSDTNTPLIENIQAVDCVVPLPAATDPVLHWAKGGVASFDDFAPMSAVLKPNSKQQLSSGEGRCSSQVLPFFNLTAGNGGVIGAIGWSGTWAADFSCDARRQVRIKAGVERTHLTLHPGETIRSPRMLLMFYEGERQRGQNLLRQFLLTHHRPQQNGKPLLAPITCGNWGGTRAAVHLDNIAKIVQQDLPIAYYWIDAEWFGKGGWPVNVGDWRVKADLYPNGFKPLSAALRKSGRELMLWFEPERVYKGTPWHQEHPEWLLQTGGDNLLLNLGNPAARVFLTDFISSKIEEFGLGCYRQDFNIDPLPFWKASDAEDRQGITEIKYIEGLYAFWDELLRRYPGLIIDNCASGGRRIDLETVGRATPFWRTDGPRDAIAHQCHTYGLLSWVPLSATSQDRAGDVYEFRSSMCSALCLNWWVSGDVPAEEIPANFPFPWAKQTLNQYLSFRDCYYGDYYPLTSYSQARDVWMAYQLDRPDLGRGFLVVLRRPESPYESARLVPRGLEPGAKYKLIDSDTGQEQTVSAEELSRNGVPVLVPEKPGSKLLLYSRE